MPTPKPTHPYRQYSHRYPAIDRAVAAELAIHHAKMEHTIRRLSDEAKQAFMARAQQVFATHEGLPVVLVPWSVEDENGYE